ncbi:MAG: rhamnulokinase [Lentisphaerae bacterium]|nr:rhamnulokinase [Lentisphaerota bacterium]
MTNFLAFDLGASSGRAIIGSLENGKLSLQEVHRFVNGHKRINNELFWDYPTLVQELKTGLKKAAAVTGNISAVGIDTWGVDYVLFDRNSKEMITLPYHYRDDRGDRGVELVQKVISKDDLYRRTGIQFMPLNTIYQLAAHKNEKPQELENAVFLHMPDALGFALGGDFTTEYTDASTGNLLDPVKRDWDWELIDLLGLPRELFPEIVPPCTFGGKISAELAAECGLAQIPIVKVGSHDTASAVGAVPVPAGAAAAYVSCGTWALLGCELDNPCCDVNKQTFTNEGGLNGKIRYLSNIMGCWLLQECRRDFKLRGMDASFDTLEAMAESAEPCGFVINPNAADFVAPDKMPERIKNYCIATRQPGAENMDESAILRAVYDSLALCFADKLAELEKASGTSYKVLNIIGGGTQDGRLMQAAASAIGKPVVAGPIEATAIGNILAQAITTGDLADWGEAREVVRNSFPVETYEVDAAAQKIFAEGMKKFKALP